MSPQEKMDYFRQHFELYWEEEMVRAMARVMKRMVPHFAQVAVEELAADVVSKIIKEHS